MLFYRYSDLDIQDSTHPLTYPVNIYFNIQIINKNNRIERNQMKGDEK